MRGNHAARSATLDFAPFARMMSTGVLAMSTALIAATTWKPVMNASRAVASSYEASTSGRRPAIPVVALRLSSSAATAVSGVPTGAVPLTFDR